MTSTKGHLPAGGRVVWIFPHHGPAVREISSSIALPDFWFPLPNDFEFISALLDLRAPAGAGYAIEDPRECGPMLDRALKNDGPAIIEAVVDPNEPPMPGNVTAKQALHLAEALARGAPDRKKIMQTIFEDRVRELV